MKTNNVNIFWSVSLVLILSPQLMALDVFIDCRDSTRNINEVQKWLDVSIGWTDEKVISSLSPKGGV